MLFSYNSVKKLMIDLVIGKKNKDSILAKYDKKTISDLIVKNFTVAIQNEDAEVLDCLVYLVYYFELKSEELLNIFNSLLLKKWHYKHEDIVRQLAKYNSESSIECLKKATIMQYSYLMYEGNETFALAKKCIKVLSNINNNASKDALIELSNVSNDYIADMAKKELNL